MAKKTYREFYVVENTKNGKYFNGNTELGAEMFSRGISNAKEFDTKTAAAEIVEKLQTTFGVKKFKCRKMKDTLEAQTRAYDAVHKFLKENEYTTTHPKWCGAKRPISNTIIHEVYLNPDGTIGVRGGNEYGWYQIFFERSKLSILDTTILTIADAFKLAY